VSGAGRAARRAAETKAASRNGKQGGPVNVPRPHWPGQNSSREAVPQLLCAICGKPIEDPETALSYTAAVSGEGEEERSCHFDCVLDQLRERERLESDEIIAYIGKGRFGVLKTERTPSSPIPRYTIERIVQWEPKDAPRSDWRRILAERNSNI
jgi:hypothetical protein